MKICDRCLEKAAETLTLQNSGTVIDLCEGCAHELMIFIYENPADWDEKKKSHSTLRLKRNLASS